MDEVMGITGRKILFVIDFSDNEIIGGHIKSAMQIMDSFIKVGYQVFFLINNRTSPVLKTLHPEITLIQDNYKNKYTAYYTRARTILKQINAFKIDLVVAMDTLSTYYASLACAVGKVALIPIIPGGGKEALEYLPLQLEKTIVFSEENKENLIDMWKFNPDQIVVRNGRLSFDGQTISTYEIEDEFRMAFISGLRTAKLNAFRFFLDQVQKSFPIPVRVDILGDGQHKKDFVDEVKRRNLHNVHFVGYREIDFDVLKPYHLVSAQGRGAIEAMSMGIPVAICGDNGYKGLITMENIGQLIRTNLTGRGVQEQGNLEDDVAYLQENGVTYNIELNRYILQTYDVKMLRDAIIEIYEQSNPVPFRGSMIKTTGMNLKTILIGASHQFDKYILKK